MTDERPRPDLSADPMDLATAEAAVRDVAEGRLVLLLDDSGREPRGVLVAAAETITPGLVNFMVVHGRGLVCAPMPGERLQALGIPMVGDDHPDDEGGAAVPFAVSVDARAGTTSGTSAEDRALTIRALAAPTTRPVDLSRPGHVMPIRTVPGGMLRRGAYPEAAVDLVRMAGLTPCSATCEVLGADGRMAGYEELRSLAMAHGLVMVSLRTLIRRRIATERLGWDGTWPPGPGPGADLAAGRSESAAGPAAAAGPVAAVRAVCAVTVWVTDQDRALDFYVGKLGFVKRRDNEYRPGARWIEVGLPASDTTLALICRPGGPATERRPRYTEVILGTEDLAAAYEGLRKSGVEFRTPPTRQPWGTLYTELQDPDGNVFVLVER
jgi:3,4-dihydroxy-2-butanone 4-phosphate synthase